jgi:hypothetical protein
VHVLVVASLVLACGVRGGSARAARGFSYAPDLSNWATTSLELATLYTGSEKKVVPYRTYIRCYASTPAFEAPLIAEGVPLDEVRDTIAYYGGSGGVVNLRAGTCRRVRRFTSRKPLISARTASAMATLLHETLHRQGLHSERTTECYANDAVLYAGWLAHWRSLRRHDEEAWRASERYGRRASALAFAESARIIADDYQMPRSECRTLVRAKSWGAYRRPR